MKTGLLTALSLFIFAIVHAQWFQHESIPSSATLHDIHFVDSQHGWIVGKAGTILFTADGGTTWIQQSSNTDVNLMGVCFADHLHGWVAGGSWEPEGGIVIKTSDGGLTWGIQFVYVEVLNDIYFLDTLEGWVVGYSNTILHTQDGGINWNQAPAPTIEIVQDVIFVNDLVGYIGGTDVVLGDFFLSIIKTSDGGQSWQQMTHWSDYFFSNVFFYDETLGWFTGSYEQIAPGGNTYNGYVICKTSSGASGWSQYYNEDSGPGNIYFTTIDTGWAVGHGGMILDSQDGGINWNVDYVEPFKNLNAITFTDKDHGWTVGNDGTVLYIQNATTVGIDEPNNILCSKLLALTPNPVSDALTIEINIEQGMNAAIFLTDVTGSVQKTIYEGFITRGKTLLKVDMNPFEKGLYLIKVQYPNHSTIRKLIKI